MQQLRFLESVDNLKPRVQMRFGRQPSTTVAREMVACLVQGRLFYEAAATSPLEIRPLQLFYGMVGFAKALIVASRSQSLATLRGAHGVKDVSSAKCRLTELQSRIENEGTFQEFNDVVASQNRFCYFDNSNMMAISKPAALSQDLKGMRFSFLDLLSRIPGLEGLYERTLNEPAKVARVDFFNDPVGRSYVAMVERDSIIDREALKRRVIDLRLRFPFLSDWRVTECNRSWNYSVIKFENFPTAGIDEFGEPDLLQIEKTTFIVPDTRMDRSSFFPWLQSLPPLAGGFGGAAYTITPYEGQYLSEFSLHYLALFALSSLVRYRPRTWMHALSRSSTNEAPADDRALSLVEMFLEQNAIAVPGMLDTMLNPAEDKCWSG